MINFIIESIPWLLTIGAVLLAIALVMIIPTLLVPFGLVAAWLFIRSAVRSGKQD